MFEDAKEIMKLVIEGKHKEAVKLLKKTSIENVPAAFLYMKYFSDDVLDPITFSEFLSELGENEDEELYEKLRELFVKVAELEHELKKKPDDLLFVKRGDEALDEIRGRVHRDMG